MRIFHCAALVVLGGIAWNAIARSRSKRMAVARKPPDRTRLEERHAHKEELDTYQDLLDESLQLTFPASDPVCAQAATRCADPCETPSNAADWHLHPGSRESAAPAS
jgi:hypothetical protein